ncbi:thioredoxin [candidate division WWE3 bacterium CG08_land_8_20_14_0_20_40_13]|uniref:Thioredoxin n=1 Tax=candidate division WWE3 bacterium CG08_land_8_20_14_0_20_40_13 TaxID=1975084 RepID=A0A2H0XCZ6_UNCKA|nr:MAG: thioredoxin [candidate division WWE3 bacterium CG08_land_8_20_14_0_20_40_13]
MVLLIDFFAPWCGPCRAMSPIVDEIVKLLQGKIEFESVDVDQNPTRAKEFSVMSIPTLVVVKDGKEVSRKVGGVLKTEMESWVRSFL